MLSENFKKIQKNREHLELIWSSYRWDVPTFWTLSALAYFLFHAILKNKKKKLEENGVALLKQIYDLLCSKSSTSQKSQFWKNLRSKLDFRGQGTKNVSFECRTFGKNFRYKLPKKVHFLRMRFLNEFTFKTAIYAKSERPAGRPAVPKFLSYSMSEILVQRLREARASREARAIIVSFQHDNC